MTVIDIYNGRYGGLTISPGATRICVVKESETFVTEDAERAAKASRGVPMKVPTACVENTGVGSTGPATAEHAMVTSPWCRVEGLGLRVQGYGFRVQDLRLRLWG